MGAPGEPQWGTQEDPKKPQEGSNGGTQTNNTSKPLVVYYGFLSGSALEASWGRLEDLGGVEARLAISKGKA